jgi:hypothetical protein
MKFIDNLKEKVLANSFIVSQQPVQYKDLLRANALFNEGMHVDPAVLNFRLQLSNAYLIYAAICAVILIPIVAITHVIFINVDFHISILGTIFATSCVFVGFHLFQDWLRSTMTARLIQKAWKLHFPHFSYEKNSKKVEEIYNELVKNEVPKKEWERYILDRLSNVSQSIAKTSKT